MILQWFRNSFTFIFIAGFFRNVFGVFGIFGAMKIKLFARLLPQESSVWLALIRFACKSSQAVRTRLELTRVRVAACARQEGRGEENQADLIIFQYSNIPISRFRTAAAPKTTNIPPFHADRSGPKQTKRSKLSKKVPKCDQALRAQKKNKTKTKSTQWGSTNWRMRSVRVPGADKCQGSLVKTHDAGLSSTMRHLRTRA